MAGFASKHTTPVAIACGTIASVQVNVPAMVEALERSIEPNGHPYAIPELWDGAAAKRLADICRSL